MHLRGQYSNPSGPLKALLDATSEIPEGPPEPAVEARTYVLPRLRMGAIGGAVLDVLAESSEPMRPRDIHASVQRHLHRIVSRNTVGSFLSVAARSASMPVIRTGPGRYGLAGHSVADNQAACSQDAPQGSGCQP
jgi:hypothetical protein